MTSFKVNDKLYLVQKHVPANSKKVYTPSNVNNILVLDCSGSMSYELPKIREQIKRKLPKLMHEGDTLSIIWFSGRGQFGTLLEAEPVATLADLSEVEKAVDRWLRPVGMTGFKEPLEEVSKLVTRVTKKNSHPFSLMFLSDGCDNQWDRTSILKATENAATSLSAATFVEYGYYADRPMLSAMAEKAGGSLIFAADFDQYSPQLETTITKTVAGKKVQVDLPGDVICGFAYALSGGEITTYGVENGSVSVPENLDSVWYLSPTQVGQVIDTINSTTASGAAYAALSLFSIRAKSDVVWALLKTLGDTKFIDSFAACFGKQRYTQFMEETKAAAFDSKLRLEHGYDPNKVPADDAFTVLDLLELLQNDPETRLLLDLPDFKYSRIGRGRLDADTVLTSEEQSQIETLTAQMKSEKDPKVVAKLAAEIASISNKPEALKFVQDPCPEGYPLSGLVLAEDRPNVSVRVRKYGTVDLSKRLPDAFSGAGLGKVPSLFKTFVYRAYTLVKDGLINVEWLPLSTSKATYDKIKANTKSYYVVGDHTKYCVNLSSLPVINRKMVNAVSAKELFEREYELLDCQAGVKVFKSYLNELFPTKAGEAYSALYGEEAAQWLKDNGISETNGFNPKSVQAPATDVYMAKELSASIKGYSSLPSLKDVQAKLKSGKLNGPGMLMAPYVALVESKKADPNLKDTLAANLESRTNAVRNQMLKLAKLKFAIVVGQVWPTELPTVNDTQYKLTLPDGKVLDCKLEMKEVEVKI